MYRQYQRLLEQAIRLALVTNYPGKPIHGIQIPIEQPPNVQLGDYSSPVAFQLVKVFAAPPPRIAQDIVRILNEQVVRGFARFDAKGPYVNARLDRAAVAAALVRDERPAVEVPSGKILVEHSSINPNKAAHIGHLRNAILGDTFVRLLRFAGRDVDVQNYIDNTGVQVADVVVGFLHIEKKSRAEIEELASQPRFDYYCWGLYARVSQWYDLDAENKKIRLKTLHEIEQGGTEAAAAAEIISVAVLRRHLETMDRLDIEYDFLPRESEILRLHFWDAAFGKLREAGVLTFEDSGKNKGCWVMRRAGTASKATSTSKTFTTEGTEDTEGSASKIHRSSPPGDDDDVLRAVELRDGVDIRAPREEISEEDQKVIVRSNGTVGYVGKDIAYHMWKFGLLGKDFGYLKFYLYPDQHQCWISAEHGEREHPHFGDVAEIYNVIDARQAEAQSTVIEALRGLGHGDAAEHYTHFSYEMVALTPRCAAELGYALSEEDRARAYIEVSGRKGFGVKADDLLDALIASAKGEVDSRHSELTEKDRLEIAEQIAIGALRYFMLKYTKPSVIAFDFKEALSFEGETGPYAQYAAVRASNIFRKGGMDAETFAAELSAESLGKFLAADELWALWLAASKTAYVIDQCIATTEPAYLAKHVFQLAQLFNAFYHRYPILSEEDEARKKFLLATAAVVRRELVRALGVMGIEAPRVM